MTLRSAPRDINPEETFERIVLWVMKRAQKDKIPGVVIGLSGTDSLVTFLACYEAYKRLGMPERVVGVHFVHESQNAKPGEITCASDKGWFESGVMPWLEKVAPGATLEVNRDILVSDDNARWGALRSRALRDLNRKQGMVGGGHLYVVGTHNRSEEKLGTFSIASMKTSIQPIVHLYKTEVLKICEVLGLPEIALQKSREVDCDCGRFDVQANHLNELDYYIMVQDGELDAAYLDQFDPEVITSVQEFYAEERANNKFRTEIPYRPSQTKIALSGMDVRSALAAVSGSGNDVRPVSAVAPLIIIDNNTQAAHKIVTAPSENRDLWRPEAFTLLGVQDLSTAQTREMTSAVFGEDALQLNNENTVLLAKISGRMGQYAFSFPAKRFTTMRFDNGLSLIERAGFTRQERTTDIRDPALPKSNPQRDEFGIGFTWSDQNWYVEQRRAYTLFANLFAEDPVALLIRNSSYFYGRDRLPEPVYVSWGQKSSERLLALTKGEIIDPTLFTPWQDVLKETGGPGIEEKLRRTAHALGVMDHIDLKFAQWLKTREGNVVFKTPHENLKRMFNDGSGFEHLRLFLRETLLSHVQAEKPGSPLYLAELAPGAAPWQPRNASAVTTDALAQLKAAQQGGRIINSRLQALFNGLPKNQLVLISGQHGDFPVKLDL